MVGLRNVAQALATLGGAALGGYAQGAMADIQAKRQAYMDQLQAERENAANVEERAFKSGEAEKERGFKKELAGEERAWEREKLTIEEQGRSSRAKKSGGGGSSSKETAAVQNARFKAIAKYGAGATDAQVAEFLPGGDKAGKPSAQMEKSAFLARAKYGENFTPQQQAEFLAPQKSDKATTIPEFQRMANSNMDTIDPNGIRRMSGESAQVAKEAQEMARQQIIDLGGVPPGGARSGAAPADEVSPQESVREVEQPGVVSAPPTAGKGGPTAVPTPKGSGSESSPYLANSEEELEWVKKNGSPGSHVKYGGWVYKLPDGKK